MIVLGFDPGTATTGFGVLESVNDVLRPIDVGVILTPSDMPTEERLLSIYNDVNTLLDKYNPDTVATERLFFDRNVTNALSVGRAIGVIVLAVAQRGLPWMEYTPMQVKTSVTGYGGADKNQIQQMVVRLLGLAEVPKPDDAADALAIDYLFNEAGLHRVEIDIRPENAASLRVVEKLGLRHEGTKVRFIHIDGAFRDHHIFAITKEEVSGSMLKRLANTQAQ